MKPTTLLAALLTFVLAGCTSTQTTPSSTASAAATAATEELCLDSGPQTPRDITSTYGLNPVNFELAPESTSLNLCNIHTHTNAEHKGPGFSVFVDASDNGGYACNDTASLSKEELTDPWTGARKYEGVKPGDTIEVHWVYSSCDVQPGQGLGACVAEGCDSPLLRVEAQVFLVVNDPNALNFMDYVEQGGPGPGGFHQPQALPVGTGEPVVFRGSTTGPSYTQSACSPFQVTWSVRPQCARIDISSLHEWAASGNVFEETESHGVRQLVTEPRLLSPIR